MGLLFVHALLMVGTGILFNLSISQTPKVPKIGEEQK